MPSASIVRPLPSLPVLCQAGARFPKKVFGAISWRTYAEVAERARNIGKGLLALGMKSLPKDEGAEGGPKFEDTTAPHTVLVYEETCADWLTFLFGAWSQSLAVATSYATLGMGSVADAAVECNVKGLQLCSYPGRGGIIRARISAFLILYKNHLEERLLDQAQARASYTPLFWGHSRSIPQGMILDVQPLVKSLFCPIRASPNGFFDFEASTP